MLVCSDRVLCVRALDWAGPYPSRHTSGRLHIDRRTTYESRCGCCVPVRRLSYSVSQVSVSWYVRVVSVEMVRPAGAADVGMYPR